MRMQDLQHWRYLVLMAYAADRISMETARAKCREITRAIEEMAEHHAEEEYAAGSAAGSAQT